MKVLDDTNNCTRPLLRAEHLPDRITRLKTHFPRKGGIDEHTLFRVGAVPVDRKKLTADE